MPDDTKTKEGQDSSAATEGQESKGDEGQEPKTFDADYVRGLRREAADWRKKAQAADAKVQEHETAKLSDTEKYQKLAADAERGKIEAETRYSESVIRADFIERAHQEGVTNLRLAYLAAQSEGLLGSVEDGKVGAHDFATLKSKYPDLFRSGGRVATANAGASGTRPPTVDMNAMIRSGGKR